MLTPQAIPAHIPPGRIPYPGVQVPKTVKIVKGGLTNTKPARPRKLLVWDYGKVPAYNRVTDASLIAFARLGDAKDAEIRKYAARYGVLEAMEVISSSWDLKIEDDGSRWQLGRAAAQLHNDGEPIELWRLLAQRLKAVLRIAAAFKGNTAMKRWLTRNGFEAQPEDQLYADWELLHWGAFPPATVPTAQEMFAEEINWWLTVGGVRLRLGAPAAGWRDAIAPWRLETAYHGLIGGLAYRLLLTVIGEKRLFACDECGEPYIRTKRPPQPGQENFCENCPDAAAKRALQRHRKKQTKKAQ